MTDYVRELQSLELALKSAEEHGYDDTATKIRGQIPGAVATCRRELVRLEGSPQNYGSAGYAQDVDHVARLREALAKYEEPKRLERLQNVPEWAKFNPSEHDVPDTLFYLEGADVAEAERVLDAEAAGKARKTLLDQRDQILARKRETEQKSSGQENTADKTPKETT